MEGVLLGLDLSFLVMPVHCDVARTRRPKSSTWVTSLDLQAEDYSLRETACICIDHEKTFIFSQGYINVFIDYRKFLFQKRLALINLVLHVTSKVTSNK